MLTPIKHMNPDRSVLALSAALLERLRKERLESYSSLVRYAKSRMPVDGDVLFSAAISLLYLLGTVGYRPRSDAFEYTGL